MAPPFADPRDSYLLHDVVTGDPVIIAPGRRFRPDVGAAPAVDPFSPHGLQAEHVLKRYGRGADVITAIENRYPVFHRDRPLNGRQELLAEGVGLTPFSEFPVSRMT